MLDSLALLVITFIVMSVISILGVVSLFLLKNEKLKKGIIYFLAVWGVIISYCNISSLPIEFTGQIAIAAVLGVLGAAAIGVMKLMKSDKRIMISKILVTLSVIAGMIDCFLI